MKKNGKLSNGIKKQYKKMPKKNYLFHKKKIISSCGFQTILNSV